MKKKFQLIIRKINNECIDPGLGTMFLGYFVTIRLFGVNVTSLSMAQKLNFSIGVFFFAFFLQLFSTILFCIIEGWHYKATSPMELTIDALSLRTMYGCVLYWVFRIAVALSKLSRSNIFTVKPEKVENTYNMTVKINNEEDFNKFKAILENNN